MLEREGVHSFQTFLELPVVADGLGQDLILRFGQRLTDGPAFDFAGPEVVRAFFDRAPALAPDQWTGHQRALADPGGVAELGLESLISRGRRAQVSQGGRAKERGFHLFLARVPKIA